MSLELVGSEGVLQVLHLLGILRGFGSFYNMRHELVKKVLLVMIKPSRKKALSL
jgi:hypothetical protein